MLMKKYNMSVWTADKWKYKEAFLVVFLKWTVATYKLYLCALIDKGCSVEKSS